MVDKNYSTEMISNEIRELLNEVETFITKKDVITECIKYSYLQTSNNN